MLYTTTVLYAKQNKLIIFIFFTFREERILFIMEFIAPAVMNGGFSTIVALSLLG